AVSVQRGGAVVDDREVDSSQRRPGAPVVGVALDPDVVVPDHLRDLEGAVGDEAAGRRRPLVPALALHILPDRSRSRTRSPPDEGRVWLLQLNLEGEIIDRLQPERTERRIDRRLVALWVHQR